MTIIKLRTSIHAPIQQVFDLSRDIDLHQQSASQTQEKAIAGITTGLIEMGETVTWRGKHFGCYLQHQSKITALKSPSYFVDEMLEGHFAYFKHQHYFQTYSEGTHMLDVLEYNTPYGLFGRIFDFLFLKRHLHKFLIQRNFILKQESEKKAFFLKKIQFILNFNTEYGFHPH